MLALRNRADEQASTRVASSTCTTNVVPRESATEVTRLNDVPFGLPASDWNGGRLIARGAAAVARWRVRRNIRFNAHQDDVQPVVQGRVKGTASHERE